MKILYTSLLSFILLVQFVSCKKETVEVIDFSKHTATDINCATMGTVDSTDWTYDEEWSTIENSLMNFSDNILVMDSMTGYVEVSPACPNPSEGLFVVGINTERGCKMKLVCVNTEMEPLFFTSKQFTGGPIMTAYDFRLLSAFHKNMNYRMYYAFYNAQDSVYYKGHGDFRID
ncbi:MAG: hypothetical protein V4615_08860 [Bacteroidota bacterium]